MSPAESPFLAEIENWSGPFPLEYLHLACFMACSGYCGVAEERRHHFLRRYTMLKACTIEVHVCDRTMKNRSLGIQVQSASSS